MALALGVTKQRQSQAKAQWPKESPYPPYNTTVYATSVAAMAAATCHFVDGGSDMRVATVSC